MKTKIFLLVFILCSHLGFSQSKKNYEKISVALSAQEKAWNNGDIEGYMAYYWKSDSLKFIGKSGITYGWQNTLDKYKKSYPDKETMGKLVFSNIKMLNLDKKLILVTGSWKLERSKDSISGFYSLFWKKINGKWLIILDHTS